MPTTFTKMQALGNDFIVINGLQQRFIPDAVTIQQWADRHTGIGFDQLLLLEKTNNPQADFRYRIFNADGGEVAQCGNGARCLAKYLRDENLTQKNLVMVETSAGLLELKYEKNNLITVNMGIPVLESEKLIELDVGSVASLLEPTYINHINTQNISAFILSIGNPHAVLVVDDLDNAPVAELGSYLSHHPHFPHQANIGFMQIIDNQHIRLRVYERGVGETQACGSGACAAVIAGHVLKKLAEQVKVELTGGQLQVKWEGKNKPVFLTGPAVTVYKGEIT